MIKRFIKWKNDEMLVIKANAITPSIYQKFHRCVGFRSFEIADIEEGLKHDLYDVVVFLADVPVAMGRLVGDNRLVFFFKDIIVLPAFQHMGLGSFVMENLMEYIKIHACSGAQLALMCTRGKEGFYEKYGFVLRESGSNGSGMVKIHGE